MDPLEFRDIQTKLEEWLEQGYQVMADDFEGDLVITRHFVPVAGEPGREREQEFWPRTPEVVELLQSKGIPVSEAMSGEERLAG
jgi:hypothetical protein